MTYRERVCKFGSHGGLIGIMTEPVGDAVGLSAGRPAIVVSNIGLNHRPGPNRIWVEFARQMAGKGFVTLRFDVSGLGDSASRRDTLSDGQRHQKDLREAIDFVLQKKQLTQVALMGLCSGVDPVHAVALEDPRVSHACFIDGYHYDTVRHLLKIKWLRWMDPRYFARGLRRWRLRVPGQAGSGAEADVFDRTYPPSEKLRQDIDAMLARGTQLYFCFTGGFSHYYSYQDQFFDMLPQGEQLRGLVNLTVFPQADHLFSGVKLKKDLYQSLEQVLRAPAAQTGQARTDRNA